MWKLPVGAFVTEINQRVSSDTGPKAYIEHFGTDNRRVESADR